MISQLTVFLDNQEGRLAAATNALAAAGINMHSLNIAESAEFGILRIICDTPEAACKAMKEAGYQANIVKMVAVKVPNKQGGLAGLLSVLDENNLNIEYGYCFSLTDRTAIDVLRIKKDDVEDVLKAAGFEMVSASDIYEVD